MYPAADGEIVGSVYDENLGCQVTIDHGGGWMTEYSHLFTLQPESEQRCIGIILSNGWVTSYDRIGVMGCTGDYCTNNEVHLHFVVENDTIVVDPSGWDVANVPDPWEVNVAGTKSFNQWMFRGHDEQTISPVDGGDLTMSEGRILVTVPQGYYSAPLTFNLSSIPVPEPLAFLRQTSISFSLTARDGNGNLVDQFEQSIGILVNFLPNQIFDLSIDTLSIYTWDDDLSQWIPLPTTVDVENHTVFTQVNHLSLFALMGKPFDKIYLPVVVNGE